MLTRLVSMAIPDEVAQYAEGKRIVSYFPLGEIQDGDKKKKIWLWTTTADSKQPWDFDSFRVFVWSLKRHRYETGYIERNLKGYAPVLLKEVEIAYQRPARRSTRDFRSAWRRRTARAYAGNMPCLASPSALPANSPAKRPRRRATVQIPDAAPGVAKPPPRPQPKASFVER